MHPVVAPMGFLLGVWEGEGRGLWSSDPVFRYRERVEFTEQGGPFIAYRQSTSTLEGDRKLHAEAGYLRPGPDQSLEMVLAQPTGLVEVHTGRVTGQRIALRSVSVGRSPRAVAVTDVARVIEVTGPVLAYHLDLAMNGEPLAAHLEARLHREGPAAVV